MGGRRRDGVEIRTVGEERTEVVRFPVVPPQKFPTSVEQSLAEYGKRPRVQVEESREG